MKKYFWGISILFIVSLLYAEGNGEPTFATIGTGGVTGVYYPVGGAIGRQVNQKSAETNLRIVVESTGGSVFNINAVLNGDLEFGIAQSDRLYQAYNGLDEWEKSGQQKNLRSLFSLHGEAVTLVARVDSGIASIIDLEGKRVNIGNVESGQLQNSKDILAAFDLSENNILAEYVKAVDAPMLVQDGRLDAFFFTVGHPAGTITEATSGRSKVRFVPIAGSQVDSLLAEYPYYAPIMIPASLYPQASNTEDNVPTIGMLATLVTSSKASDLLVYTVVKVIMENLDSFKAFHPSLAQLTKERMLQGLTVPLHDAAAKYYEEIGLEIPKVQ